jgi:hypothetical protein
MLKTEKGFDEFVQSLAVFMVNTKMVDPHFVWNPINPDAVGLANITSKGKIPTIMTMLGSHVKVSGGGYTFMKQRVHKENKAMPAQQGGCGNNEKEQEYKDPTMYFNLVISSDVDPLEIITCATYEWTRINGQRLQIKELQDVASKTVVSFFKLSMETAKGVIIAELEKILNEARETAAKDDDDLRYKFNWSMDLDTPMGRNLPIFTLQNQVAKLWGKDVSIFNKLSYRAQNARKSYHLEFASKHAAKIKELVQYAKDAGIVEKYWGSHVHVSEVTNASSSLIEAKRQCKVSQSHTNYQVSMVLKAVSSIVDINNSAEFLHPVLRQPIGSMSLQQVMLKYLKMSDGHSLLAEVHQAGPQLETTVIVPHTPEAKRLVATMNKNVSAFLWHMLLKQGLPDNFIQPLLKKACDPTLFTKISTCKWDVNQRTLTTKKDSKLNEKLKAFENVSWFKNEFGLLNKSSRKSDHIAPKALYNLDGGGSYKTIHNCHKPAATSAKKGNTKKVRFADNDVVDSNEDSSRGSASQSGLASSGSISIVKRLLPRNPSRGIIASTSSSEEEGTLGATKGG